MPQDTSISLLRYQVSSNWYTDSMWSQSQSFCRNWQDDFIYMKIQIGIATIVSGKKKKKTSYTIWFQDIL